MSPLLQVPPGDAAECIADGRFADWRNLVSHDDSNALAELHGEAGLPIVKPLTVPGTLENGSVVKGDGDKVPVPLEVGGLFHSVQDDGKVDSTVRRHGADIVDGIPLIQGFLCPEKEVASQVDSLPQVPPAGKDEGQHRDAKNQRQNTPVNSFFIHRITPSKA